MSDMQSPTPVPPARPPFPVMRLVTAFFYGLIAWFVLHVIFVLAAIQFVVLLMNGRTNAEIKSFCASLIQYEWELLAFIGFVRDEQPFPFGPFPKTA